MPSATSIHTELKKVKQQISTSKALYMKFIANYKMHEISDDEAIATVLSLNQSDIYKTMPSHQNPNSWQDVYHKEAKGIMLYIKLQIVQKAIVISFKEK